MDVQIRWVQGRQNTESYSEYGNVFCCLFFGPFDKKLSQQPDKRLCRLVRYYVFEADKI